MSVVVGVGVEGGDGLNCDLCDWGIFGIGCVGLDRSGVVVGGLNCDLCDWGIFRIGCVGLDRSGVVVGGLNCDLCDLGIFRIGCVGLGRSGVGVGGRLMSGVGVRSGVGVSGFFDGVGGQGDAASGRVSLVWSGSPMARAIRSLRIAPGDEAPAV